MRKLVVIGSILMVFYLLLGGAVIWNASYTKGDLDHATLQLERANQIQKLAFDSIGYLQTIQNVTDEILLNPQLLHDESESALKKKAFEDNDKVYDQLKGMATGELLGKVNELTRMQQELSDLDAQVVAKAARDDRAGALALYFSQLKPRMEQYKESSRRLAKLSEENFREAQTQLGENNQHAFRVTALSAGTGVALGAIILGIVLMLVRSIMVNMLGAVDIARQLSTGDLTPNIEIQSSDEVAELMAAIGETAGYLRHVATVADRLAAGELDIRVEPRSSNDVLGQSLQKMVETQADIVHELKQGVQHLSTAANQLVGAASQQSAATSEQASSIYQVLSTLDEVREIVNQTSSKAKSVVNVSEQSLHIAEAGQQALEQAKEVMSKIRDQVDAIADNILELSEKAIQIGEITQLVTDIAEQSNLLALNAAIEATKAGEAGRGFGVVAVEVRNLATQSKEATAAVRSILREIQQATLSTASVIQEGHKRVESGVDQVREVGDNIRQLYDVVVEASNASLQIAADAHQQAIGIEQITAAVKEVSVVANKNASGAREQSETAENLSELANKINHIVERYRLTGNGNGRRVNTDEMVKAG
jgi:methyl-accepting chemotaxis protein